MTYIHSMTDDEALALARDLNSLGLRPHVRDSADPREIHKALWGELTESVEPGTRFVFCEIHFPARSEKIVCPIRTGRSGLLACRMALRIDEEAYLFVRTGEAHQFTYIGRRSDYDRQGPEKG
jgi:hypothetical protein